MAFGDRIKHAWDAFTTTAATATNPLATSFGATVSTTRPDRPRFRITNERTIISAIYTRMAIDVSSIKIEHCKADVDTGMYIETIPSGLNDCLNIEANLDQSARHFRQDIAMTLFAEGVAAIVPVDTTYNPILTGSWDVKTFRVGRVIDWYPQEVLVRLYNEKTGRYEDLRLPKRIVAIVENPFYSVMNEPNSTLQRLIHKLSLLDNVDEISSQGKLDIIIQLPYVVKSESRKQQAKRRVDDITDQLQNSTYGIAYTDGTEKITQLNRAVENTLLEQVQYLKQELYKELGLTENIMNGTASDAEVLNYVNRTIEPIMDAIVENMTRKFLTKTARTQGQTLMYFDTPLKLIPMSELAKIIDALSRNQIATPNEIRPAIGLKPSKAPQANLLVNSNMPLDKQVSGAAPEEDIVDAEIVEEPPALNPADVAEADLDRQMAALGL